MEYLPRPLFLNLRSGLRNSRRTLCPSSGGDGDLDRLFDWGKALPIVMAGDSVTSRIFAFSSGAFGINSSVDPGDD